MHIPDHVWRPNRLAAPAGYVLAAIFVVLGVAEAIQGQLGAGIAVICVAPIGVLATWRLASVPYVAASSGGIVVQNPILRRTIQWQNVASVECGYAGLVIRTKDGDAISAWAIQKSNLARWTHSRTRADDVAAILMSNSGLPQPE